jgi:hypothetical protein
MKPEEAAMKLSRIEPTTASDLAVREMLLHDVFELPPEPVHQGWAVCAHCGESAETVADVHHRGWCVYLEGLDRPSLPS